jgi:DNA-binding response OmpR family regulator
MSESSVRNKVIVLVEDDDELAVLISDFLARYNFDVITISNGVDAVDEILCIQPDLVILDVMLPGMNGMDVCKKIRSHYTGFILMQTALDEDIDQIMGLEIGADDYIVKQVQPRLLLSRINALLRRTQRSEMESERESLVDSRYIKFGPLTINLSNRNVELNQKSIELTSAEFELLVLLSKSIGKVVSREDIIQQIRGFEYDGLDRSIDRRVSRLRKKLQLKSGEDLIKTVRGIGYQLCIYHE